MRWRRDTAVANATQMEQKVIDLGEEGALLASTLGTLRHDAKLLREELLSLGADALAPTAVSMVGAESNVGFAAGLHTAVGGGGGGGLPVGMMNVAAERSWGASGKYAHSAYGAATGPVSVSNNGAGDLSCRDPDSLDLSDHGYSPAKLEGASSA
jgi:hypothetical protein